MLWGRKIIKISSRYKLAFFIVSAFVSQLVCAQALYETYIDENHGFSIEYVSGWKIQKSKYDDGGIHFIDDSSNPPVVAVNVNRVKTNQSLKTVSTRAKEYVSQQPGVTDVIVLSENVITASQMEGIENIMTYKISGNEIFIKSAYLVYQDDVFSVSMAGSAKIISEMQESFKHMIQNIKLL